MELNNIAQKLKLKIPQKMKEDHREKVEELKNTSGNEFDKKYINMVNELHEEDIDRFEDIKDDIQNEELKNWVDQTLSNLKDHKKWADKKREFNK